MVLLLSVHQLMLIIIVIIIIIIIIIVVIYLPCLEHSASLQLR